MRPVLAAFLLILTTSACTTEWGDWFPKEKQDEDEAFFCSYYKNCGKGDKGSVYGSGKSDDSGGDSHVGTDHSTDHSTDTIYGH